MGRGFIFIIIFIFGIFFLIMGIFGRFIRMMRGFSGQHHSYHRNRQQYNPPRSKPTTQGDRIAGYQKKTFSKDDAVDVEFEEVK